MSALLEVALVSGGLALGFVAFLGLGSLLVALADPGAPLAASTRFWLGVTGAFALLAPLHLVVPVGGFARGVFVALALAGAWRQRGPLLALARATHWLEWLALGVMTLLVAAFARAPLPGGDAALYHVPAVRLVVTFPVLPGAGNLNPFLGYSHGNFLLHGLLEVGPFAGRSHHLVNPLLVLVTASRGAREALGLAARVVSLPAVVGAISLLVPLSAVGGQWLASPSSNVGEALFVVVLTLELLHVLRGEPGARAWVVALLAVGAVVFKLSAAVVAASALALALPTLRREVGRGLVVVAAGALLAGGGWVAGGAVRTGYLLYPFVVAPLPVDWRMDPAVPASVSRYIAAYTRGTIGRLLAGEDDGAWYWGWLERALLDNSLLVPTMSWACLLALILARKSLRARAVWLVPTSAGLVAWFVISPDPQYLGALLVLQVGIALGAVVHGQAPRVSISSVAAVFVLLALVTPTARVPALVGPGLATAPAFPTVSREVSGGTILEAVRLGSCGAAPPPCAGLLEPGLRYRVPGDARGGFAVRDATGALPPGFEARWRIDRDFILGGR